MRKNQLTRQGFMELNLLEATEKEGDPADLWISLEAMGYNRMLELVDVRIIPQSLFKAATLQKELHFLTCRLWVSYVNSSPGVSVPDRRPL